METSRLTSFSSPVRPHLSKEETPDPESGPPDEELRFDKDKDVAGEGPLADPPLASSDDKVQPAQKVSKSRKREHPKWSFTSRTKPDKTHQPTLFPLMWFLSVTCLVVTVATTVSHIVLDTVTGAAIILGITCPIIVWGIVSLVLRKSWLICTYAFLLVFQIIALTVAGGLEAKELKWQIDATNDISNNSPTPPPATVAEMLRDARRRTTILAAFTGLYFLCSLIFIITAIFAFHLYGEVSVSKRLRLHRKGKHQAEQDEKAEKIEEKKKKEGAVRVPQRRAPSPDLLDEEELLDVEVTSGGAQSPEALAMDKQAQMV